MKSMRRMQKRVQKGFTLIELMIVVAIIGILAAIAIPQYQDYVTRSRWSDNITSIAPLKQAIAECTQNNAQTAIASPCDATGAAGLGSAAGGGYTATLGATNASSITYTGGVITIVGNAAAGGCTVTITPVIDANKANAVTWQVANAAGAAPAGGGAGAAACSKSKTGV